MIAPTHSRDRRSNYQIGENMMNLDQWAADHQTHYGKIPLLIGREYLYDDSPVLLIEASEHDLKVTVQDRFGQQRRVEKDELAWKPTRTTEQLAQLSDLIQ